MMNSLREVATQRDALILQEREKDATKAAEAAAAAKAEPAPALPPAGVRHRAKMQSKGPPPRRPFLL